MLFVAETHDALLDEIARQLAATRDVRGRHWLVFPRRGLREVVLQRWARLSGVASHSQEVELRELVEQASGGGQSRFDVERLRWTIAGALPGLRNHPAFPLPADAALDPMDATVLSAVTQWAGAMHETLTCRPGGNPWPEGSFLAALAETEAVAGLLQTHPGLQSESDFLQATDAWMDAWDAKGGIPHLWILLDAALPSGLFARLLSLLDRLGSRCPGRVHLFAMTPSLTFWADQPLKSRSRRPKASEHALGSDDASPGGLLWALGRSSQDLQRALAGTLLAEGDGGAELPSRDPGTTLLGRLQASCRQAETVPPADRLPLEPTDASLTVHATHPGLRELEVCRDRILQAFHELPDLRPEQVLVLLTNPREQAPWVEAAFGADVSSSLRLPHRMPSGGGLVPSPFASTLLRLLEGLQGRLTLDEIEALLENPLVADRFDLDHADGDGLTLVQWLRDARFRWGLSPQHRHEYQAINEPRWTLEWALRRLGLGGIVAEATRDAVRTEPGLPVGIVPLERATGLGLGLLARLARLADSLAKARRLWCEGGARPIAAWNEAVAGIVRECLSNRVGDAAAQTAALHREILEPMGRASASAPALEPTAYLRLLSEKLRSLADSGGRGLGGITVADLRHHAGVPARLVVVAGLDDGVFPRSDDRPAWHPLALAPAPGDPTARDSDRHCLLMAILACGERLVLTYGGHSDADGGERPPSTALADVIEAVDQVLPPAAPSAASGRTTRDTWVWHHPLHGFSPAAFRGDLPSSARGFRTADHRAAESLVGRRGLPPLRGPWASVLPEAPDARVHLDDLRQVLDEPQRLFAARLGLRWPEESESTPGDDLIELDSLERWSLRDRLLRARIERRDPQTEAGILEASGVLPRGPMGRQLLDDTLDELPDTSGLPEFAPGDRLTATLRFELPDPDADLKSDPDRTPDPSFGRLPMDGRPRSTWYRRPGDPVVWQFFASKPNPGSDHRRQLLFGFDALALAASASPQDPHPIREARCLGPGQIWTMPLPDPPTARARLARLVPLARLARRLPLPFWPRTTGEVLKKVPLTNPSTPENQADFLEAAFLEWSKERLENTREPDCRGPLTRALFRGCDDPFALVPEGLTEALPDPGTPLAWRLVVEIQSWFSTLHLNPTKP